MARYSTASWHWWLPKAFFPNANGMLSNCVHQQMPTGTPGKVLDHFTGWMCHQCQVDSCIFLFQSNKSTGKVLQAVPSIGHCCTCEGMHGVHDKTVMALWLPLAHMVADLSFSGSSSCSAIGKLFLFDYRLCQRQHCAALNQLYWLIGNDHCHHMHWCIVLHDDCNNHEIVICWEMVINLSSTRITYFYIEPFVLFVSFYDKWQFYI